METIYYKVMGGAAQKAVDMLMDEREVAGNALIALCKKLGAVPGEYYGNERHILALKFDQCPNGWKPEGGDFYSPKGNSREARAARAALQECRLPGTERLGQLLGTGWCILGNRVLRVSLEVFKGNTVLHVPAGMKFTPPDENCVPMKASEYWTAKESIPTNNKDQ